MIFFTCQNGHRLHSQTLQPGQWIRCPRCGIVTQIPEQSTISTPTNTETSDTEATKVSSTPTIPSISSTLSTESESVSSSSGTSSSEWSSSESQRLPDASQTVPWVEAEMTDGTSSSTEESMDVPFSTLSISQTETPLDAASNTPCEPEWEFLCPNGHLLHSTQAFQGRLGECPECHSRFRIPTLVPTTNPTDATDASNASTSSNATKMTGNGMGNALGGHRIGSSGSSGNASNSGNAGTGNLAGLNIEKFGESFTRLWELHRRLPILLELEQGRRVVISEFHADLSDDVLGVFTGYVQSSSAPTSESASDTSNHSTPEKPETLAIPWYSIVLMRFASEL